MDGNLALSDWSQDLDVLAARLIIGDKICDSDDTQSANVKDITPSVECYDTRKDSLHDPLPCISFAESCDVDGSRRLKLDIVTLTLPLTVDNDNSSLQLCVLCCQFCQKYLAAWCNGGWNDFLMFLRCGEKSAERNCIRKVIRPVDFLAVYILSQVYHNQRDLDLSRGESPFYVPTPSSKMDVLKVVLCDSLAVGFYSVHRKGHEFPTSPVVRYDIDMVDTIYVKSEYRRQGLSLLILDDIMSEFSGYVGFTQPLSAAMLRVLDRYLRLHPEYRDRLWACSYTGELGYRYNIYLQLKTNLSRRAGLSIHNLPPAEN